MQLVAAHFLKVQIIECTLITRNVERDNAAYEQPFCPSSVINKINHKHLRQTRCAQNGETLRLSCSFNCFLFFSFFTINPRQRARIKCLRPLRSTVFVREPLKSLNTHTHRILNPVSVLASGFIAGRFTWTQLTRINPASVRGSNNAV